MVDLNDVAIFVKVVECGSIAAAARQLDMPANTLSRRLASLEHSLSVNLLNRSTRRLHVTAAGNRLYEQSAAQIASLHQASLSLADDAAEPCGRLRVAAPSGLFDLLDLPLFARFMQRYPAVEFDFVLDDSIVNVLEQGIDVSLRAGPLPSSTLRSRRLLDVVRVAVASPGYVAARGMPQQVADLAAHTCLVHSSSPDPETWTLVRAKRQERVTVRGRVRVNSVAALAGAARAGMGIALVPVAVAAADLLEGRLVRVLPDHATAAQGFFAIYPGHRERSRAVHAFIEFAVETFAAPERLATMRAALDKRPPSAVEPLRKSA